MSIRSYHMKCDRTVAPRQWTMLSSAAREEEGERAQRKRKEGKGEAPKPNNKREKQSEQRTNKDEQTTRGKEERQAGHKYNNSGKEPGAHSIRSRQVQQIGTLGAAYHWRPRPGRECGKETGQACVHGGCRRVPKVARHQTCRLHEVGDR